MSQLFVGSLQNKVSLEKLQKSIENHFDEFGLIRVRAYHSKRYFIRVFIKDLMHLLVLKFILIIIIIINYYYYY